MADQTVVTTPVAAGGSVSIPVALADGDTATVRALGPGWAYGAPENGSFTVPTNTTVRFGANGKYLTKTFSGKVACTRAAFGGDPLSGTVKHCDYQVAVAVVHKPVMVYTNPDGTNPQAMAGVTLINILYAAIGTTGGLKSIVWSFDGKPDVTLGTPAGFDTTKQTNAAHVFAAVVTYTDGQVVTLSETNTIGNAANPTPPPGPPPIVLPFPGFQQAHDAASAGSTIVIPPGTYQPPSQVNSSKQGLIWQASGPGVILDGSKAGITSQQAVFLITGAQTKLVGWSIQKSGAAGLMVNATDCSATDFELASNGQEGYVIHQPRFVYLRGSIHDNNPAMAFDPQWEAGGGKVGFNVDATTFDSVDCYNNGGPTLWVDTGNTNTIIRNCRVHDNAYSGIMYECSSSATITGNFVWNNGWGDPRGWGWRAGILVSTSQTTEVYGNIVAWNGAGISFIGQNRGDSPAGGGNPLPGLYAHDNIVIADHLANIFGWYPDGSVTLQGARSVNESYYSGLPNDDQLGSESGAKVLTLAQAQALLTAANMPTSQPGHV